MKIKYGTDTVDLEPLEAPDDVLEFARTIPGQKHSVIKGQDYKPNTDYILFDECTEKETALRNLLYVLEQQQNSLSEKIFPPSMAKVLAVAKQAGQEDMVKLPAIDFEDFRNLQKIVFTKTLISQYVTFLLQARVGFGLALLVTNSGQIYTLKDTRKLFAQNL